jgi:hypothetical protein
LGEGCGFERFEIGDWRFEIGGRTAQIPKSKDQGRFKVQSSKFMDGWLNGSLNL